MNEENSLWMGDISPDIDESMILQSFQYFNIIPINIKLIKDKKTNINQNYCFVSFKNLEDTNKALHQLNGKKIPNTNMTFKLKKAFYHSPINRTIYVGNLDKSITNELLLNFFQIHYSSASKATIIKEKGISKGYGFVVFKKENEYKKSLTEMDGALLEGKNIIVREQKRKDENEMSYNNNFINKISYNNINNFPINNNDYHIYDNIFVNNNINKDLLYKSRNNNAINDYSLLKNLNIINNNNELLKNEYQNNNNINNLINNGIININKNIINQNNNIINFINFEKNNTLYEKDISNKNYINNNVSMNRDINKILLLKNSNINNSTNSLNNQFYNKIDNNILYNNANNSININNNQNTIKNNKINNIKKEYNMSRRNDKIINSKANLKKYNKLEILENFDEKTLIKKINDSINSTFYHYKKLNLSNGSNNIKSKYFF